ncbi:MAG TPA: hypothetical protein PKC54_06785 [Ferruginibacter sp.]|nr:hypothetical protein [Ferruginibacter sp.]
MKKYIIGFFAAGILFSACKKKVDPVDTYGVTVEYRNSGPKFVTGNVTVNPKDSIYFDFTITSQADMSYVEIQKNGVRIDTFRLNGFADKKTFSLIKGYRADSAAGNFSYRVLARDAKAVFMGDGGKQFTVTVTPDFNFWSYRILAVPDTVNKTNKCYYSSVDGKIYSYTDGAANSAKIDFGYYWDTTGRSTTATGDDLKHTIYSLSAAQPQLGYYDISTWTKNVTLLKKMPTSVNFVSNLTSGGAIQTLIGGNMASGTASKVTLVSTTAGSNVIGFRTAAGKYGAILIRYVNGDSPAKETQIEVDVKVQK